jgi:hypothetical protein
MKKDTKNIVINGTIYAEYSKWNKKYEFGFVALPMDSTYYAEYQKVPLSAYAIELEMPSDIDLHSGTLKTLQNKRKLILAENQSKLNEIDGEIKEFLAIENKS